MGTDSAVARPAGNRRGWVVAAAFVLVAAVGILDYVTGPEISFSIFYLVPTSLAAWLGSRRAGVAVAVLAAAAWLVADLLPHHYTHVAIAYWNAGVRLAVFLAVALLLASLRQRKEGLEQAVAEKTAALRASEARLQLLIANARDYALFMLDPSGRIAWWNDGAAHLTGLGADEAVGAPLARLYPSDEEGAARAVEAVRAALARGAHEDEGPLARADGSRYWAVLALTALPGEGADRPGLSAVLHDITERKALEDAALRTAEAERRRIGHDLHDVLGQELTGVAFLSKELEDALTTAGRSEGAEAARIVRFVNQAIERTRGLARGLAPLESGAEGLMQGLERLARHVEEVFRVPCELRCPGPVLVEDEAVAAQLYRIAQEAVSNAVRHASPGRITIELREAAGSWVLKVEDDGVGLPAGPAAGMGLRVMEHRARSIGGKLRIGRGPAGGASVVCAAPRADMRRKAT